MKRILITLALAVAVAFSASAQSNSIGFSFTPGISQGSSSGFGIEFKHDLSARTNLDIRALYYTGGWGTELNALYEWNFPIVGGLKAYVGPGVTCGIVPNSSSDLQGNATFTFGFAGVIGLEYDFSAVPLGISLDWQPLLIWQTTYTGCVFAAERPFIGLKFRF